MVNYREAYGLFASNGILFNHESPRRGENFVTRKITVGAARIKLGLQKTLAVGNLDAKRDWGYAPEYCEGMWRMLQQKEPGDFVLATGESHTVREFVDLAFLELGIELEWKGEGVKEKGISKTEGKVLVEIDPEYYRPTEVEHLIGDPTKALEVLGWRPKTKFAELVKLMVQADLKNLEDNVHLGKMR